MGELFGGFLLGFLGWLLGFVCGGVDLVLSVVGGVLGCLVWL